MSALQSIFVLPHDLHVHFFFLFYIIWPHTYVMSHMHAMCLCYILLGLLSRRLMPGTASKLEEYNNLFIRRSNTCRRNFVAHKCWPWLIFMKLLVRLNVISLHVAFGTVLSRLSRSIYPFFVTKLYSKLELLYWENGRGLSIFE